jgi:hypothetical protein
LFSEDEPYDPNGLCYFVAIEYADLLDVFDAQLAAPIAPDVLVTRCQRVW